MRLIDTDAFLKEYCEPYPHIYKAMKTAFEHAPAVDAIPIDYMRSQIDCEKWEEIIVRWREVDTPTVDIESHWIPVSEGLPKEAGLYMVTDSKGDVVRFVFENTETSREYWKRCAKAWMPLPEPYTEEAE